MALRVRVIPTARWCPNALRPLTFRRKEDMNQQVCEAVRHGCIALSRACRNGTGNPRLKPWAIAVSSLTGRRGCFFRPVAARPGPDPAGLRATRQGRYNDTHGFREACRVTREM